MDGAVERGVTGEREEGERGGGLVLEVLLSNSRRHRERPIHAQGR